MKNIFLIRTFSAIMILLSPLPVYACAGDYSAVDKVFGNSISIDDFIALSVNGERMRKEYIVLNSNKKKWNNFLDRIENNEGNAVIIGLHLFKFSKGGNLGDIYRSLSISFSKNSELYLRRIASVVGSGYLRMNANICRSLFVTLPYSFVDKEKLKLEEYRARLTQLSKNKILLEDIGCSSVLGVIENKITE